MYPVFLTDFLKIWPREQILVLRSEDYAVDVNETMKKVFRFLNLRKLLTDLS